MERNVWHRAVVGYDAVTGAIIKLRNALDDDARDPRYIATVPKRGYRLLPGIVGPAPTESGVAGRAAGVATRASLVALRLPNTNFNSQLYV